MLHSIDPGILFLQQEDVIKAGVLDVKQVISAVETTYAMLGRGELNTPSKINMSLPSVENWQSFFNSMPAYIGGSVNVAGFKWAAESKKNAHTPGIPYGIDITILSDPETVLPFCILDGTLITAMRTAAVGALHAKFAAPSFAETATLIGAGVIGRVMVAAVHETLPQIKTIYLCDTNLAKAEAVAAEYGDSLGVKIIPTSDSRSAALKSQLIVCETPCRTPILDKSFLTPGCGLVSMMCAEIADEVFYAADSICVDYWQQLRTCHIPLAELAQQGKIDDSGFIDMSELVLGTKKARQNDRQFVFGTSLGLGALDVMIGYQMYENASRMGLGTQLKLWNKPLWE